MATSTLLQYLWPVVVIVPIIYVVVLLTQNYRALKRRAKFINQLPGADPHWIFGNINEVPGPHEVGLAWIRYHSNTVKEGVTRFWYGPFNPAVTVFHPNSVKTILKTSEPKPLGVGAYFMIKPWLGDGLLLSHGPKWARNRRLLTPAFHFDILRPYMEVNNRCTDVFLDKLEKFAAQNEFIEMFSHVSLLTLDIILRCAFSYENDCQLRGESHPYVAAVNSLQMIAVYRMMKPYLYPDLFFNLTKRGREFRRNCKFVHDVSDEIIRKRKEVLDLNGETILNSKGRYLDFLDILLTAKDDSGQGLTHREIRDEVDTFLFEGHDTTASGISWTLWSLAAHPQFQQKCQQEVDEVLSSKERKDIEWDDLGKLKYLTMCIKESLRVHAVVPFIERQTTQDMTVEGFFIPSGSIVDVLIYALHHNQHIWENPEEFRPERFDDDNTNEKSHFSFVPFSAGPRNCIGQHFAMHEMKTVIAKILSRFTITLDPDRRTEHKIVIVMKTEDGMYLKATPRAHVAYLN